jgi:protein phosphatase-4 regulatory subunit 3
MKDMIKFCMTHHETEIKTLAESPLGGQRFQMFIRRWEMNNEPPPPAETKTDRFVAYISFIPEALSLPCRPLDNRGWPSQSRVLDSEEENYFNADDDDDGFVPAISQAWSRGSGASSPMPTLKRKRRAPVIGPPPKGLRLQSNPQALSRLSDYGDEDEEDESNPNWKSTQSHGLFSAASSQEPLSPELTPSSVALSELSPGMKTINNNDGSSYLGRKTPPADEPSSLQQGATAESSKSADGSGKRPSSQIDMAPNTSRPQLRPKRQRVDDDDDDELMARLTKSKRPDLGAQKAGGVMKLRPKPGEDPAPKKFKLKIGKALAATPPSEASAKDGDRG